VGEPIVAERPDAALPVSDVEVAELDQRVRSAVEAQLHELARDAQPTGRHRPRNGPA